MSSPIAKQPKRNVLKAPTGDSPQARIDRLAYFNHYASGFIKEYSDELKGWTFEFSQRMQRGIYTIVYRTRIMRLARSFVLTYPDDQVFVVIENMVIYAMLGPKDRKDIDKFDLLADVLGTVKYRSPRVSSQQQKKKKTKKKRVPICKTIDTKTGKVVEVETLGDKFDPVTGIPRDPSPSPSTRKTYEFCMNCGDDDKESPYHRFCWECNL